jgi:hypothetical protein
MAFPQLHTYMWHKQIAPFIQHLRNSISLIHVSIAAFSVCDPERDRAQMSSRLMYMGAGQKTGEAYTRVPMMASNEVQ